MNDFKVNRPAKIAGWKFLICWHDTSLLCVGSRLGKQLHSAVLLRGRERVGV